MTTPTLTTEQTDSAQWKDNPAFIQLLGLTPLLAMSTSAATALALGLCLWLILLISNLSVAVLRPWLALEMRIPTFVLILAALTTGLELLFGAVAFTLQQSLGVYLPLLASSTLLLVHADRAAETRLPLTALRDALSTGFGFLLVFLLLGMLREVLGSGSLFAGLDQLLPFASGWQLQLFASPPFVLAGEPAAALLLLGALVAGKNAFDQRRARKLPPPEPVIPGSKRVRLTGKF